MRQEHDGALTWTSRRGDNNKNVDDKNKRGWSNDDEQLAISHYHHHVKHGLLDEESQMDEGEVEDVAELLLEEPPNLVSDGDCDKWREEQKEESVMELSLAEKRARIMANVSSSSRVNVADTVASEHDDDEDDGAITVDESNDDNVGMMRIGSGAGSHKGGSDDNDEGTGNVLTLSRPTESVTAIESETEVESLPMDVGVLFANGVTDDSPIAHAADIRDDEALLNDAEKVLDIINEAEAQLDSVAAVESKEGVELAVASDADEDVVMVKGDAADVEVNDVETPDEGSPSPPIIPPALISIVDGITSIIMPSPPQTPPTNHTLITIPNYLQTYPRSMPSWKKL
ncbi:hypothetical protein QTG54_015440 [Skeletonema marinoi]|uniref:Uncharacterized protein n=1 Tax=Skeletonema marinoi TaxID=267567 RepID=A0AAD8XUJ4_9STRA|nr:hypothetical protein QTG54_015440 [Skeletonema marinoi]